MNTFLLPSLLILLLLELFEAWWQKSDTMRGVLERCYGYYHRSIFLFFLMHPTFYFILFVALSTHILNGWMVAILLLKSVDIFFKIALMRALFVQREYDDTIAAIIDQPLSPWIFLTGATLYPFLLFYALS